MEREPERRMGVREGGHGMMICGPAVTFNQDIDNSMGDSSAVTVSCRATNVKFGSSMSSTKAK